MPISLLSNLSSLNVKRQLEQSSGEFDQAAERLSSGKRINHAGDDAAGQSIGFTLEAKLRSLQQAKRNSQDALSMMQVAEGAMGEVSNLTIRLRELAIQASSDDVGDEERKTLQTEADQVKQEISRIANSTQFLDEPLLNGKGKDFTFQIGPDNTEYDRIQYSASTVDLRPERLGLDGIDLTDSGSARDALGNVDEALKRISAPRSLLGAMQARLHSIGNTLDSYEEGLTAAKSRIEDADVAQETANMVRSEVLQKAGVAVLAQANAQPALALKLINE